MRIEDTPPRFTGDASISDFGSYLAATPNPVRKKRAENWNYVTGLLILAVGILSLAQTRIELDAASPSSSAMCAVVVAKLIWICIGSLAISGKRSCRGVFAFLCCASVLAVGPALPSVFSISRPLFWLLLTEYAIRALCLAALLCNRISPPLFCHDTLSGRERAPAEAQAARFLSTG
ncbi:hypothetical protein [Paraburkholderia sp. EG304]|uniref:hypothetical protein n=1 Tax=Paraburkholderia sp. EG304 TaxID=3237015 RepID=UPI00397D507A